MLLYTLAGLVVGALVGATGVGGGSLMTPLLITLFGMNPAAAIGTDLLYAAATKGFGTLIHGFKGTVEWPVVARMAVGSLPGCGLTLWALHDLHFGHGVQGSMVIMLGATIVATALLTLMKSFRIGRRRQRETRLSRALQGRLLVPATVLTGFLVGVLVTLTSVGGGVIGASALFLLYPSLPAVRIIGSDIAHAVLLTAIAGAGHLTLGTADLPILGYLLVGSFPGIVIGTYVGLRLPDGVLRPLVASLLLIGGIGLFF